MSVCALVVLALASYAAPAEGADTFEPNDTRPTATPIASGSPRVSYLSTSGDVDYYQFTLSSWQHVRIDFLDVPAGVDGYIDLYEGDGRHIDYSFHVGEGLDERLEVTLAAGAYYIRVAGFPSDGANSYTLSLTAPLGGDDFEPNNTLGTATDCR